MAAASILQTHSSACDNGLRIEAGVAFLFGSVPTRPRPGDGFAAEPEAVQRVLGDAPFTGFNSCRHIAQADGRFSGFHNCTAVVCGLRR